MNIDLNKFLNKRRKLTNRRWQAIIAAAFTRKVSFISALTIIVILGMYASSILSGKMFSFSNTIMVIGLGFIVQMLFSTKGINIIKEKDFGTVESKSEEENPVAEVIFDAENFYAQERVGKSFVRYNLVGSRIKDYIDKTVILQLKDGSTCAIVDDANTLNKKNAPDFIKNSFMAEKNEFFESGKKNISFDKALKLQENWSDILRAVVNENFGDLLDFIKRFDKVIFAYVVYIFFKLGAVLSLGVSNKIAELAIVGVGILAGVFVAMYTRKTRITFGGRSLNEISRYLYLFETGIYNVTDSIEEYYSFKDLASIKVYGDDIVLNFEIGEVIVIKKDIFENHKEYFVNIESQIEEAMGHKIEKVASVN
ncbi:MAG: hypothetical protein ACRCWM_00080 [Sarcina sp.]